MAPSALGDLIQTLTRGERISQDAIDELDRLLQLLKDEGWSGAITADAALEELQDCWPP